MFRRSYKYFFPICPDRVEIIEHLRLIYLLLVFHVAIAPTLAKIWINRK
ncbi:MAG: hypothetical protein QNJ54_09585 [Prochloraceae cyanobacterium]|nr:hypothetical protein [Prochloraceae cyanobacterium]